MTFALVLLVLTAYVGGLAWFALRCPRLQPREAAPADAGCVSVLIPARNEAPAIAGAVRSALDQGAVVGEILVVDDGSTDGTPEVVRDLHRREERVRLLQSPPLPPGWHGKAHALAHGSAQAHGAWLLFVDADTRASSGALAASLEEVRRQKATFLSLWPRQRTASFWERAVQPVVIGITAVGNALRRLWGPPFPVALSAWGVFILVRAEAYRRVGGHATVRDRILEDSELCDAFRAAGEHAVTFDGHRLVSVHMYEGLGDLWEGWRKNLFPSLGSSLIATLGVVAFVLLVTWGPVLGLGAALLGAGPAWPWTIPLALQVLAAGPLTARLVDAPPLLAVSPLGGAVYAAMLLASAYAHVTRRGVSWKGRSYGGT
ncbi:MAG: glycosyltransferase family 2 protein [Trueperaceae bacterium]|nr:glycosyltransferase family 2 protein [Trueperaceae bacterium]